MGNCRSQTRASSVAVRRSSGKALSTMGKDAFDVVIVGGGNSAGYLCKSLADQGFDGSVAVVSAEPVAPYERPALTKAFLHPPGAKVRARLPGFHTSVGGGGDRQTPEWYSEHNIDLMLSTKAVELNAASQQVKVEGGDGAKTLSYKKLVLATGARALTPKDIKMENPDLGNVFTIREEEETHALVNKLEELGDKVKRLVIVGGGYIGMETACAFVGWGFEVAMVFPEDTLMSRLFPDEVGRIFENYLTARGVTVMSGKMVSGLVPSSADSNLVGGVKTKGGETIEGDVVIFGVGSRLNGELFKSAGLETGKDRVGGVAVNGDFQSSDANIYAIGDIAAMNGGSNRYEHVDFCRKSAAQCGTAIASGNSQGDFSYLPYFYSRLFEYTDLPTVFQFYGDSSTDQGQKIHLIGQAEAAKDCPSTEKLPTFGAVWYQPGGTIKGVMLCNASPEQYDQAKQTVLDAKTFSETEAESLAA